MARLVPLLCDGLQLRSLLGGVSARLLVNVLLALIEAFVEFRPSPPLCLGQEIQRWLVIIYRQGRWSGAALPICPQHRFKLMVPLCPQLLAAVVGVLFVILREMLGLGHQLPELRMNPLENRVAAAHEILVHYRQDDFPDDFLGAFDCSQVSGVLGEIGGGDLRPVERCRHAQHHRRRGRSRRGGYDLHLATGNDVQHRRRGSTRHRTLDQPNAHARQGDV